MPRPLVLCADDYAIAPGVSRGIVELAERGRLSATSCMSVSPFWPEHAARLKPLDGRIDIGLHLTLTDVPPLGSMPRTARHGKLPTLGWLMASAALRRLDRAEIAAELTRQVDAFEAALGRPPDFLDGHQHVHQLAGVRECVVDLLRRRLGGRGYVRVTEEPLPAVARRGVAVGRAAIIALLAGKFSLMLRAEGIPANAGFGGVHDFSGKTPYRTLFRRFLSETGARPLIMCHPGHADAALAAVDPVTVEREAEWQYFAGDDFPRDLADAGYRLARFAR
ncbi:MAG TPA: ChbG/HpnK family deacetylase [Candidatus Cybelea sp.]|nr:ChbG/HpnK family deacetylase [Candidatus Cybelea sp.]